jgi:hypothetical protein
VFVRAGALLPLAAEYDSLAPAAVPDVRVYTGDLVVRVMPGDPGPSSFTLYDGTQLDWDGSALIVRDNAQPRSIELRAGGNVVRARVTGRDGRLQPT